MSFSVVGVTVGPIVSGIFLIICGTLVILKIVSVRRRTLERRRTRQAARVVIPPRVIPPRVSNQINSGSGNFTRTEFPMVNISHNSNDMQLHSESELCEQPPPSYQDARRFNTYQPTSDKDSAPTDEPPAYNVVVNDDLASAVDQLHCIQQL